MPFSWGTALLVYLTVQRLAELWWAKQNERQLLAEGGIEYGRSHLPLMILLHAAWLVGLWVLGWGRPVNPIFFVLFVILQLARFWVLFSLGGRWSIRVIVVPGEKLVARGPYRWIRHPNYAVVIGEIAAVPLALGMPLYALVFSILNAIVLAIRVRVENAALGEAADKPGYVGSK
ncbi:MAG TPA: isoprenylcysteine carboxylmethyltransferase family protein [Xanthobacteraceae bacterium]|jgi:methyltransferase|nr:isoprenylcysteine carboxylmethyltransferase family protein [Xanthobacteraceae bacterium]